jgi:hypothetical protein
MTGALITIPGIVDFIDTIKMEMDVNETLATDISSGKNPKIK